MQGPTRTHPRAKDGTRARTSSGPEVPRPTACARAAAGRLGWVSLRRGPSCPLPAHTHAHARCSRP